jgi:flagellar hook-basal body complex protein FliE
MAVGGINGLSSISPSILDNTNAIPGQDSTTTSFASYLNDALNKTNDLQLDSEKITNDFAVGKTDNIHQVMIASEKADVALQFTMQIRNKILDAYNEIMRIQI